MHGIGAALTIGVELGVTPPPRAARATALLDALGLGSAARRESPDALIAATAHDKKVAGGKVRWVLPTANGYAIRDDVPATLVLHAVTQMLAGTKRDGVAR